VQFRAEIERESDDGGLEARIERLERLLLESGKGDDSGRETRQRASTTRQTGGATPKRAARPASARRATGSGGGNAPKR
jgi:hypothetical protein